MSEPTRDPSRPKLAALAAPALASVPPREVTAARLQARMRWYAVWQVLDLALLLVAPWTWLKVAASLVFAAYRARTVWTIIHDRVHQPKLPVTPTRVFYDFCTGWIAIWWRKHHLAHHANTNTARDPDTTLLFGRDTTDVRRPPRPTWRRWANFLGTVAQYPVFFLVFFASLRHWGRHALPFFVGIAGYAAALSLILPPWEARLHGVCNFVIGTIYIVGTFAPTHTAGAHNFATTGDRDVDALTSTNDVWPESRLYSWLCGGINQHVEHHMFPHVPNDHLGALVPVVKAWAAREGLPYPRFTPWGLWRAHLAFLRSF